MLAMACGICFTPWDSVSDAILCDRTCRRRLEKEAVFNWGQRIRHKRLCNVEGFFEGTLVVERLGIDEQNEIFYIVKNQKGQEYIIPSPGAEVNKWVLNVVQF
jgi:hypothetical protein